MGVAAFDDMCMRTMLISREVVLDQSAFDCVVLDISFEAGQSGMASCRLVSKLRHVSGVGLDFVYSRCFKRVTNVFLTYNPFILDDGGL